eukprot:scaffold122_cov236-Pinguiococcus_pyrenoidosus.AAC.5
MTESPRSSVWRQVYDHHVHVCRRRGPQLWRHQHLVLEEPTKWGGEGIDEARTTTDGGLKSRIWWKVLEVLATSLSLIDPPFRQLPRLAAAGRPH